MKAHQRMSRTLDELADIQELTRVIEANSQDCTNNPAYRRATARHYRLFLALNEQLFSLYDAENDKGR